MEKDRMEKYRKKEKRNQPTNKKSKKKEPSKRTNKQKIEDRQTSSQKGRKTWEGGNSREWEKLLFYKKGKKKDLREI